MHAALLPRLTPIFRQPANLIHCSAALAVSAAQPAGSLSQSSHAALMHGCRCELMQACVLQMATQQTQGATLRTPKGFSKVITASMWSNSLFTIA